MSLYKDKLFKRGSGPLVSVIFGTRGRPKHLLSALESLRVTASGINEIEYLVKVDDDDQETIDILSQATVPIKALVSPRGNGYADTHHWLNELANHASGDWLLIWSDDVKMLTRDWDRFLGEPSMAGEKVGVPDGIFAFIITNIVRPEGHEFLACRRELKEALGHLSLSACADTQIISILKLIDRCSFCGIRCLHDNDKFTDNTATARQTSAAYTMAMHASTHMARVRVAECTKLLDWIDKKAPEWRPVD